MKNIKNKIGSILCWIALFGSVSCSKDSLRDVFKRQTDQMSFDYISESKVMNIASSEKWTVVSSNEWIKVTPTAGEGGQQEKTIELTVLHNRGDQRSGVVTISNSKKSYDVSIVQSQGNLTLDKAFVASSFTVNQDITGAKVTIPYLKGSDDDFVNVTATLQGPGASGISIENLEDYKLQAGDGFIPLELSGVTKATGEIQIDLDVSIPSRNLTQKFIVKSRVKVEGGVDPLESPTVEVIKLLPRLAVLDWGKYVKGSGISRKFELELAATQYGAPIRRYASQSDWLSSTSIGTGSYFFDHNRFVFGDLKPQTTYWFRLVHKTINSTNVDSDITYYMFTTPAEEVRGANVILYKDFDDFWFGGGVIYQAFGVQPTEAQIRAALDPRTDIAKSTDFRTMSWNNNLGSTFSGNLGPNNAPLLYEAYWDGANYGSNFSSSNYGGWYGENAFPATGAMRMGAATSPGYLTTPKLTALKASSDIMVTINSAPYFEPYHSWGEDGLRHYIIIEGDGVIVDGGATMRVKESDQKVVVECTSNVNPINNGPLYTTTKTTTHKIKVTGATTNTRIRISSLPYNASAARVRFWLDDIKVEKL